MNDIITGYIAGFFDAEGTMSILNDRYRSCGRLFLSIKNTNFEVLKTIQEMFGGYIYKEKEDNNKQKYVYRLNSNDCIPFLEKIHPYTIEKYKQIELALLYLQWRNKIRKYKKGSYDERQIAESYITKMKEMKQENISEEEMKKYNNECKLKIINKEVREGRQYILTDSFELKKFNISMVVGVEEGDKMKNNILNEINNFAIGYVSGFFDGEGCIYIGNNHYLHVFIGNSNLQILLKLKKLFGGAIYDYSKYKKEPQHKNLYIWEIFGNESLKFLEIIYEYSIVKKEQIYAGMQYQNLKTYHGTKKLTLHEIQKREFFKEKIKKMKRDTNKIKKEEIEKEIKNLNIDKKQPTLDMLMW